MSQSKIVPVLISGGAGTRLWPLSRQATPKQFHALGGARTLIQDTALRVSGDLFAAPLVVAQAETLDVVVEQLTAVGLPPRAVILEPIGRNTGPAAAAAAAYVAAQDPDALMMLIHADNRVADVEILRRKVAAGIPAAEAGALVIFGLAPTWPAVGFGYIKAQAGDTEVRPVEGFKEKPDLETARVYLTNPDYLWNSGMFLFRAGAFLAEMDRLAPGISAAARAAVREGTTSGAGFTLGDSFRAAPSEPIDTAIFEKTDKAMVVSLPDIGWSDVGSWDAIRDETPHDAAGNALLGDVVVSGAVNSLAVTDGPTVVLAGVEDIIVVVDRGVVLVTRRDAPQAMRAAVEAVRGARPDLL